MKAHYLISILGFFLTGCCKNLTTKDVDHLSLYWDSRNYGERKELVFEFYAELCDNHYDLDFNYSVGHDNIVIELVDVRFDKECEPRPVETHEWDCNSKGSFTIPDAMISEGVYDLILRTGSFEIVSEFIYQDSVFVLNIPENPHFDCFKVVEPSVW